MPYFGHKTHYWWLEGIFLWNVAVNLKIAILEATVTRTAYFENKII